MIRVATMNLRHALSRAQMQGDLERLLKTRPDVIGLQEIYGEKGKALRKYLARQGYGMVLQSDVPIAFKLNKFKLAGTGARVLTKPTFVGEAGAGPDKMNTKFARWVALVERGTGDRHVFTNAHFTPSIQLGGARAAMHRAQVRGVANLQRDLRQKYKGSSLYVMGDYNTSKAARLAPIQQAGVRMYRAPSNTHRVGTVDWIGSNRKGARRQVLGGLTTDHNAYIVDFGKGGATIPKPPKGDGGGGGKPDKPGKPGGKGDDVALSAFDIFSDLLESWGIPIGSDIQKIVKQAVVDGITPSDIGLIIPEIQDTQSWKQRFPGWHSRVSNGYNQLTVDEYLQLENQYHRIMSQAGLPAGFYDQPADFGKFIADNVSPDEIQNRVTLAVKAAQSIDPTARNLMARFYGLGTGDVAAYFLDQNRALPVIERQYASAGVAAWAAKSGFKVEDMARYENLVDNGVTADQAAQAYGTVRSLQDTVGRAGSIYGESYDQTDAEEDVFFNKGDKRRRIMAQEAATFGGSSQGSTGSAKRQSY